jgi:hypothetical protein
MLPSQNLTWLACLQARRSSYSARQTLLAGDALLGSILSRLATAGSGRAAYLTRLNSRASSRQSSTSVDLQLWTLSFSDLDLQQMIGEGSFGKVHTHNTLILGISAYFFCGDYGPLRCGRLVGKKLR